MRYRSGKVYSRVVITLGAAATLIAILGSFAERQPETSARASEPVADLAPIQRAPIDLVLFEESGWLVTANQLSNSVSLVRVEDGSVVSELPCGDRPVSVKRIGSESRFAVSCAYSGEVWLFRIEDNRLKHIGTIAVGFEPQSLAVHPNGDVGYVGLLATGEVAELHLERLEVKRRIQVGVWPKSLAITPNGKRLAVGCSGESKIKVIDIERGEVLYDEPLSSGINLGQMQVSADGLYSYFPWMVYRSNPINHRNIRQGWVLASRIGRVRLDGSSYREAISLDVPGKAVADPYGLQISPNGHRLVVSASGTHELLVYRLEDLPFEGVGGPGDLIDRRLMNDNDLFYRIPVGGRPMGIAMSSDNRTLYVANYLDDSIQQVDIESRKIANEFSLGKQAPESLVRRGMAIFYDGQRSLDQWYSCHSCHQDGGVNSKAMDTMNDGTELTMKTVLPLFHVGETSPWTWHGWQSDLRDSLKRSFTSTMQGKAISDEETDALMAFLETLRLPRNPFLNPDGTLSEAAQRGKIVFESEKAGCADCHYGPLFTDGQVHDVGLGSEEDRYEGFNTPTLIGAYRKARYLHDGRSKTLKAVLTRSHAPERVTGNGELTEQELDDLIKYVKSL